jgi:TIR domain/NB-ARC domain
MIANSGPNEPITLYYSCAQEDQAWIDLLDKHLTVLQRQKQIVTWHDGQIDPGQFRIQEIAHHLEKSQVVLILMSPDYLKTDYCYEQMEQVVRWNEVGKIHIILVLLRPTTDLERTPVAHLPPFPMRKRPITTWASQDEALKYVADEVRYQLERWFAPRYAAPPVSGVIRLDPPHQHPTILQRETLVKEVYTRLTQPGIAGLALTGLKGIGKSMLAAQVFSHAETRRQQGEGPFNGQALWLRVEATGTMQDLINIVAEALGQLPRTFQYFASPHQHTEDFQLALNLALELFKLINQSNSPRLIVLDQFEEWLEAQTGVVLVKHSAVGEWLNLLNEYSSPSRILFTASTYPHGTRPDRQMYLQEFALDGLQVHEGIELLHLWNIEGSESDRARAVERCHGHVLALVLLERLLRNYRVSLTTLLDDPAYRHLWIEDVQRNLFDSLYAHLLKDEKQVALLQLTFRLN